MDTDGGNSAESPGATTELSRAGWGLLVGVMTVVAVMVGTLGLLAVLLGAGLAAVALFLATTGLAPVGLSSPRLWLARLGLAATVGATSVAWIPSGFREAQLTLDHIASELQARGPGAMGTVDALRVWAFGLGVGALAIPVYPEVAREHLMLYLSAPRDGRRVFRSDFPMRSQEVRDRVVAALAVGRPALGEERYLGRIVFSYARDPQRLVLALNPTELYVEGVPAGTEAVARVNVRYPPDSRISISLWRFGTFYLDEGLFWALQERGWLHPYVAEWRWPMS